MELNWKTNQFKGETEEAIAQQFAFHLDNQAHSFDKTKSAVYFLTNSAGCYTSIGFWENALENSPRFANPASFPWTLTNATPGFIARTFSIEGPNYTFIDKELNLQILIDQYQNDLETYSIKSGILIIWDLQSFSPLNVQIKYAIIN